MTKMILELTLDIKKEKYLKKSHHFIQFAFRP